MHGATGDGAEQAPGQGRFNRPGEVIMQAGDSDVRTSIGEVNRPQDVVLENGFAGVEVPTEESVDDFGDNAGFASFFGV